MSDVSNPFASPDQPAFAGGGGFGEDGITPAPLDILAILQRAWELFTENLGLIIGIVAVQFGVQIGFTVLNQGCSISQQFALEQDMPFVALAAAGLGLLLQLAGGLVSLWIGLGVIKAMVGVARGHHVEFNVIFNGGRWFLPGLLLAIIVGFGSVLGMLLFIVPGIILALALQFSTYILVDQDADLGRALQDSWKAAWPNLWFLLAYALVVGIGALLVTVVTCGIGLLVLSPVLSLAQAVLYRAVWADYEGRQELGMV
jgi:hypothetical protein